jgi:hypothetical protein
MAEYVEYPPIRGCTDSRTPYILFLRGTGGDSVRRKLDALFTAALNLAAAAAFADQTDRTRQLMGTAQQARDHLEERLAGGLTSPCPLVRR